MSVGYIFPWLCNCKQTVSDMSEISTCQEPAAFHLTVLSGRMISIHDPMLLGNTDYEFSFDVELYSSVEIPGLGWCCWWIREKAFKSSSVKTLIATVFAVNDSVTHFPSWYILSIGTSHACWCVCQLECNCVSNAFIDSDVLIKIIALTLT